MSALRDLYVFVSSSGKVLTVSSFIIVGYVLQILDQKGLLPYVSSP